MSAGEPADVFQLVGTTLEGRFAVERLVAEGGFGVVYRAQQTALERPIALKVLKTPARFDEEARTQFLASFAAEGKTIARITHPNIIHVYDFGVSVMPSGDRAAWIALEWLTGATLRDELLARRGRGGRSPAECLALLKPILSALALVHAAGVAHRDLKPANIMLVPTPAGTVLKLLDFGIAKIMGADEAPSSGHTRTRSDRVSFSPGYASPEQISNGRTGPWTDVHAMGLIFSEMLTDGAPFEAEEKGLLFQQILDRTRPTPSRHGIDVGAWEAVLSRALAVSSTERYRDAGELLRALEAVVPGASAARDGSRDDGDGSVRLRLPARVSTNPLEVTSTSTPDSDELPLSGARRSAVLVYVGAGVLGVALVLGFWLRMGGTPSLSPAAVQNAPAVPRTPSASAPEAVPPSPTRSPSASALESSASTPEMQPPPPKLNAGGPASSAATTVPSARPLPPSSGTVKPPSIAHSALPASTTALPSVDTMR
jgi:eukaryotic-like serine/threonine-protein kinase